MRPWEQDRSLPVSAGQDVLESRLQEVVSRLISGEEIEVDTDSFENDFESFKNRDDVLTLLIHLGYLTWDRKENLARIPNEEVRAEFRRILKAGNGNRKWINLVSRTLKLLEDTIAGNSDEVASIRTWNC